VTFGLPSYIGDEIFYMIRGTLFTQALLFLLMAPWFSVNSQKREENNYRTASHFPVNETLVTANPAEGAMRLYQFLYDNYGSKIISGTMTLNTFDETQWLKTNTGKEPALIGLDFMHSGRNYSWYNDRQPIEDARTYYNRNGIPALCWHWRDPSRQTEEFYTAKTSFDINKIFESTSAEYKAMISDIDYISGLLKELQQQNIPVIWRPLHEAAGGWFWWGAKGAAPCKELYRVMFDRMVNYHGLNNLIWVWTREPNDEAWYPGDEYVDIVSRDIYKDGDHGSQRAEWSAMNVLYGGKKMIALSECGSCPDVDNLIADKAAWSWYMPWYGQYVRDSKYNSLTFWKKMFAHDYVVTLDEMPDLKTYVGQEHAVVVSSEKRDVANPVAANPTMVEDTVEIKSQTIIGEVLIFDGMGRVLSSHYIPGYSGVLVFPPANKGIYFIKLQGRAAIKVFKK
jgi:mannan endo-1,4-beta-mannosidase